MRRDGKGMSKQLKCAMASWPVLRRSPPIAPWMRCWTWSGTALTTERVKAGVRFLAAAPAVATVLTRPPPSSLVLLTNGRGGMARLCVDLGSINSKYDCALGANLHPEFPVDRHVLVKRLRVWVAADGFITALNLQNLASFQIGPPAVWNFVADAGDGRTVEIQLTADMLENWNTTIFSFVRTARNKACRFAAAI